MNVAQKIRYDFVEDVPCVIWEQTEFGDLTKLLENCTDLLQPTGLVEYCRAMLHLTYGTRYRLITDADAYRQRYEEQMEEAAAQPQDNALFLGLGDFGLFDVSEISAPAVSEDSVVFYVEEDVQGIPMQLIGPTPQRWNDSSQVETNSLPIV